MARKRISDNVENEVLIRSGRRCCLCFCLNDKREVVQGQIAHLDRDNTNNNFDNLAWLCLNCHDKYDSRHSQSKGYKINEVKYYRSLLYEYVKNSRTIESEKPNIETSPGYTQLTIDALPGFSQIDMLVLKAICESSLVGGDPSVNTSNVLKTLKANDISQEQTYESLEILDEKNFIEAEQSIASRGIDFFEITIYGFENYANLFIPDFDNIVIRTLTAIINEGLLKNGPLSKYLDSPIVLVNYILDILENRNFIKKVNYLRGSVEILDVTASGKRAARSI